MCTLDRARELLRANLCSGRKRQPSGCPSAGQQNRAELHICLSKHLAHCFPTDFALQGREATPCLDKGSGSRAELLWCVRELRGPTRISLSMGHLVLAVVIKLKSPFKGRSTRPDRILLICAEDRQALNLPDVRGELCSNTHWPQQRTDG